MDKVLSKTLPDRWVTLLHSVSAGTVCPLPYRPEQHEGLLCLPFFLLSGPTFWQSSFPAAFISLCGKAEYLQFEKKFSI